MYVPAYPLPIMEIAGFVKAHLPKTDIEIISIPVDYGLPLTPAGKTTIYQGLLKDLSQLKPKGVGISCTAIAQAEEVIYLCELIKAFDPEIFIFLGGYFPTIYYEEVFLRTSAVDLIVLGEGELPTLKIVQSLEKGLTPAGEDITGTAWKKNGHVFKTGKGERFDLKQKTLLNSTLLKYPKAYDILPYAFSRGCPYQCNFCLEEFIRPQRREVSSEVILKDLSNLSRESNSRTLLVSDALFQSFHLFPSIRSLGFRVNFETRCDVLDPSIIPQIAEVCGMIALGLESASYATLRRMNKIRDRAHYQGYIQNARAIFKKAVAHEIPIMVFMIAGYPGETRKDLDESLNFVKSLAGKKGPGGHVFKIGECRVYPKTKLHEATLSLPDLVFDNDGVFGQNIVRQPSRDLSFETILTYIREIFNFSHSTPKLQAILTNMMPFFRLPSEALLDDLIPEDCYLDQTKSIFNVRRSSLNRFRALLPALIKKYREGMSDQRERRNLPV